MARTIDLITLENFEAKMSRWEPDDPSGNHLFALVDMGSNGIRFSISDLSPPHARLLRCVYRERASISLFDALGSGTFSFSSTTSATSVTSATSTMSSIPTMPPTQQLQHLQLLQQQQQQQQPVLPDATIARVASTLARFRTIAVDHYGVSPSRVAVFATEAMRRAANAGSLLDAVRAAAPGLSVLVLAPPVETLFGAVGARAGFVDVRGLFLDLGGGSVQMTYMDTYAARNAYSSSGVGMKGKGKGRARGSGEGAEEDDDDDNNNVMVEYEMAAARAGESLPFGAARLIRVLEGADVEAQAAETAKLRAGLRTAYVKLRARFPTLAALDDDSSSIINGANNGTTDDDSRGASGGIDVYLCGGGFRGYGYMLMHNDPISPYPIPSVGSYTVAGSAFRQTRRMLETNRTYAGKIFGMSKRRRAQFPAVVAVVDALVAAVPRIRSATFCAGGNREGALMMKLPRVVRETDPLRLLGDAGPGGVVGGVPATDYGHGYDYAVLDSVVLVLRSAIPAGTDLAARRTSVFGLHLDALLARRAWLRAGEDGDANAAAALHDAAARDPGCPGMTHLARAVLAVALCCRWGATLGPADRPLHRGLCALVDAADPDGTFWAEYVGAVAAVMAKVVPAWPRKVDRVRGAIWFQAAAKTSVGNNGKSKLRVDVKIYVSPDAVRGIDPEALAGIFKNVGKKQREDDDQDKKVVATVQLAPRT